MSSYLFLTFILLFGGSVLIAATLDFLGLGPSQGDVARADDEQRRLERARCSSACGGGSSRPGSGSRRIVGGLYVMNVGLDEVFNPKLRRREPRGRRPAGLLPHAARRREGARRRHLHASPTARSWDSRASRAAARRPSGKSLIRLDGRMRVRRGHRRARRRRAADRRRPGDEPVPLPRGLDRPAVRDERAQPDPQDRPDDLGAARLARRLLRRDAPRAQPPPRRWSGLDDDVLDRYPIELSGGMKQRVVMVLSTLLDPSLLIADELTSALDVSTQKAVAEMLVEFRDRGFVKSMIVITHDLSILYQIADTILVMYAGKLVEKAPADGDHRHRRSIPYTQLLLASLPEVGVRFAEKRLDGHPGPAALAAQPADRLPVPRPLPARLREVRRGAAVRRGRARTGSPPAGRRPPDARARRRHEGLQDGRLRTGRADRRLATSASTSSRARSCR